MARTAPAAQADPAAGGYFEVIDRRPCRQGDRADFHVKAYTLRGEVLLHTWNTGEHSMQMEVAALISRGAHPKGTTAEAAAETVRKWK